MSGFFLFFPLTGLGAGYSQSRVLTRFPDAGANPVWLHHTRMEALSPPWWRLHRTVEGYPLRPRNDAVPAYRPIQSCGYACAACQFVSGSGEGQPTSPVATIAAYEGARAGVQSKPRALG